jgi:hypothetical protein
MCPTMCPLLFIVPLCPLSLIGLLIWFLMYQYRAVRNMHYARYRQLEEGTVPQSLSKQAQALTDRGFRFLSAFMIETPPEIRQKPRTIYVFDSLDGFTKATLAQIAHLKGTAFETVYPDGMLLLTTHGMPAGLTVNVSKDELYQPFAAKGTIQQAWENHNVQVAALRAFHGTPLQAITPDETLRLLNEHIMPRDQKQVAHVVAKQLRQTGVGSIIVAILILLPMGVIMRSASNTLAFIVAPVGAALLISPVIITALVLARRIKQKYLQSPAGVPT